jgi:hypothetical protein
MTVYRLPVDAVDPHFNFSVDLDGRPFIVAFDWNIRELAWYFSIYSDDESSTPVLEGWRVVIAGTPLARARGASRPPGQIVFVDLSGDGTDPGRDDLGVSVAVLYYDEESAIAAGIGA